jgi:hypothetical protein
MNFCGNALDHAVEAFSQELPAAPDWFRTASRLLAAGCRHFTMLLPTTIDRTNEIFRANDAHNRSLAATLRSTIATAARGGPAKNRERHVERGKLMPRDRVRRLLDPG